jgi:hypothetical protein
MHQMLYGPRHINFGRWGDNRVMYSITIKIVTSKIFKIESGL